MQTKTGKPCAWQCQIETNLSGPSFYIEWNLRLLEMEVGDSGQAPDDSAICTVQLLPTLGEFTVYRRDVTPRIGTSNSVEEVIRWVVNEGGYDTPTHIREIAKVVAERLKIGGVGSTRWISETKTAVQQAM